MARRRRSRRIRRRPRRSRRSTRRPRRRFGRYKRRVGRPMSFIRSYEMAPISVTTGLTSFFGTLIFQLSSVPNSTEFTLLFDQYRILGAQVKWITPWNAVEKVNNAVQPQFPTFHSIIDLDDETPLTGIPEMEQYTSYRVQRYTGTIKRYLTPRVSVPTYRTGVTFGYGLGHKKFWLDCGYNDVPHYGLKFAITDIDNVGAETRQLGNIHVKLYLQFKNVR